MAKKSVEDFLNERAEMLKGDESLWRLPLAQAVVEMFEEGKAVTPATLMTHLSESRHETDVLLRGRQLEAAIERLRQIVVK